MFWRGDRKTRRSDGGSLCGRTTVERLDSKRSAAMFALDLVQFLVDLVLRVVGGVDDLLAEVVGRCLCSILQVVALGRYFCRVVIMNDGSCIFCVAPGFLGDAFDLLGCARVREFLVANCFADALLDLACYLIEFTCYFFSVHRLTPLVLLLG